ncbi:MAG: hypothetical protein WB839_23390 [Pseudolabrys sp.]
MRDFLTVLALPTLTRVVFLYWLGYSGFDFGVIAAGIIWLVMWGSPNRASVAATSLLSVTILAAVLGVFGVLGK